MLSLYKRCNVTHVARVASWPKFSYCLPYLRRLILRRVQTWGSKTSVGRPQRRTPDIPFIQVLQHTRRDARGKIQLASTSVGGRLLQQSKRVCTFLVFRVAGTMPWYDVMERRAWRRIYPRSITAGPQRATAARQAWQDDQACVNQEDLMNAPNKDFLTL